MKTHTSPVHISTRGLLKVGLVANILESFEFSVYTFLLPVIGKLFLQAADESTLYIQTYALLAISFLARPLGSVFWGYYADRIGRGQSLNASLLAMSIPTALIGCLPTYQHIGFLATLLLLLLRFIQGFSKGGEYSISGCYIYESAALNRRSFLCGAVSASSVIGMMAGSGVSALLFWSFDPATLESWGWRIPYLLGVPMTFWVRSIRRSIQEPHIANSKAMQQVPAQWDQKAIRKFLVKLLPITIIGGFMELCCYTLFVWMPSYLNHFLKIDLSVAQFCNTVGYIAWIGFILLAGYLSSKLGYKTMIRIHATAMVVLLFPVFKLAQVGTYGALLTAYLIFAWLNSAVPAVMMEVLGDAFPRNRRALGMSVSQNLSATLFGGTAPALNTLIIRHSGLSLFPAFYIMVLGVLVLPLTFYLKRDDSEVKVIV